MKRFLLPFVLAFVASCAVAQDATDALAHLTVLASPEAHHPIARAHIATALTQLVAYLHVESQELPDIVVIYATHEAAHLDALPQNASITVAKINMNTSHLYQVWVTGEASDANTVEGLIWVLNRHYGLNLTPERIDAVRTHVLRSASNVVTATELLHQH